MVQALNYSDSVIRDAEVSDLISFLDGSVEIVTDKYCDLVEEGSRIDTYLIQMNLTNIKKNGCLGKRSNWLKFTKTKIKKI